MTAHTPRQAVTVHGRIAQVSGRESADQWLAAKGFGTLAEARRAVGIAESGAVAYMTHDVGMPEPGKAAKAAKKARKKQKKAAESARVARMSAVVMETLTAAGAPQPPPGTGIAPSAAPAEDEYLAAASAGMSSPFWRGAGTAPAVAAPEPGKPLHQMDIDEFQAHAGAALTAHGRSSGLGSPIWQ